MQEIYGVQYHRIQSPPSDDFVDQMEKMCNSMVWCFGLLVVMWVIWVIGSWLPKTYQQLILGETMSVVGDFDIAHAHDWMACKAMVQCKNSHGIRCIFTFHSTEQGRSGGALGVVGFDFKLPRCVLWSNKRDIHVLFSASKANFPTVFPSSKTKN